MNNALQSESKAGEVYDGNVCDFICEMYYVTAETKNENKYDIECETVPCSLMKIETLQGKLTTKTMIVLFDPGSTSSYIKRSALPVGATPTLHNVERKATTLGGETMSNLSVRAERITLPEFSRLLQVD